MNKFIVYMYGVLQILSKSFYLDFTIILYNESKFCVNKYLFQIEKQSPLALSPGGAKFCSPKTLAKFYC